MDSIFTESSEISIQEDGLLISYETRSVRDPDQVLSTGKTSVDEEIDEDDFTSEEEAEEQSTAKSDQAKTHKKPLTGLDLLIRNTSGDNPGSSPSSRQRKISFVFDKGLLAKLKAIAQKEKTYFREMVTDILKRSVDTYEKDNGKLD